MLASGNYGDKTRAGAERQSLFLALIHYQVCCCAHRKSYFNKGPLL